VFASSHGYIINALRGEKLSYRPKCILGAALFLMTGIHTFGQNPMPDVCPRPPAGSRIQEPGEVRSRNGVLKVDLRYRSFVNTSGHARYCYISNQGGQAPNLRANPGDLIILWLKNEMEIAPPAMHRSMPMTAQDEAVSGACASPSMTPLSTNLHFHGLTLPPVCHQDDVLKTMIQPGDPPFEYRFQIPADEPPGLYWYHPHIHGFTSPQVLGGASGALIVEGIERTNQELAGLPERVFVSGMRTC
jgi:FtsP/CotA-like multicopper oxidase with cupredoxin domain